MSIEPSTLVPSDPDSFQSEAAAEVPPVVVRRNAGLAALVGAAASAMAIAYLWRATDTAAVLDWVLCVVLAAIAVLHLAQLVDARTPLLVADELGVRIRFGQQWRGLPWDAIGSVGVRPRRGLARDGRLMFAPHSLGRALEGLDPRGRRAAALNQKLYGAALAVPMGLTTRVSTRPEALVDALAALSHGGTDVVVLEPTTAEPGTPADDADLLTGPAGEEHDPDRADTWADEDQAGAVERPRRGLGRLGAALSWPGRSTDAGSEELKTAEMEVADLETETSGTAPSRPRWRLRSRRAADRASDDLAAVEADDPEEPAAHLGETPEPLADVEDRADEELDDDPAEEALAAEPADEPAAEAAEDLGDDTAEDGNETAEDGDHPGPQEPDDRREHTAGRGVRALGGARRVLRAQIGRGDSAATLGNAALLPDRRHSRRRSELPETEHLRRAGEPDLDAGLADGVDLGTEPTQPLGGSMVTVHHPDGVRPIATLHDPVDPLVVDEFVTEPAYDPIIGPELAAARHRTGLSVDQLAERTRIRPHVIESIEVDDFAPCGGDFYARGHLRTLARVLGRDPVKLLALYDARYATAPINARRVFEAELATGMTGSVRRAGGGPNWGLLVGVVLALVLTWGVVRLFASEPQEQLQPPVPALNGSAGVDGDATAPSASPSANPPNPAPKPISLRLTAAHAPSHVVVRDRTGKVVWAGDLALGQSHTQSVTPPAKVHADNAGALDVAVGGHFQGRLGTLGQPGQRSFGGS